MAVYGRSLMWLIGCGSLGYVLMRALAPDEQELRKKIFANNKVALTEAEKKREQFSALIRGAIEDPKSYYKPDDKKK